MLIVTIVICFIFLDKIYIIRVKYPCSKKTKKILIHNNVTLTLPVILESIGQPLGAFGKRGVTLWVHHNRHITTH